MIRRDELPFERATREQALARLDYLIDWAERARAGSDVKGAWDDYLRHARSSRDRIASGGPIEPPRRPARPEKAPVPLPSFEDL